MTGFSKRPRSSHEPVLSGALSVFLLIVVLAVFFATVNHGSRPSMQKAPATTTTMTTLKASTTTAVNSSIHNGFEVDCFDWRLVVVKAADTLDQLIERNVKLPAPANAGSSTLRPSTVEGVITLHNHLKLVKQSGGRRFVLIRQGETLQLPGLCTAQVVY